MDVYLLTGILCQSFSSPGEICPGDNVTFTCVVVDPDGISFTIWIVTLNGGEEDCVLRHNRPNEVETCGPGQLFTSFFSQSGDNYTSTLRVESISDGLNRTSIECEGAAMDVGMENICIIGKLFIRNCCGCGAGLYTCITESMQFWPIFYTLYPYTIYMATVECRFSPTVGAIMAMKTECAVDAKYTCNLYKTCNN